MEMHERQRVVEQLAASEARLLELVEGLAPEQWSFQEAPERWSIAGNLEHLVHFERFILERIAQALEGPAEPEKMPAAAAKEPLVLRLDSSRDAKFSAREAVQPSGNWPDRDRLVAEFRSARARTVAFAEETDADLRGHFFQHIAFGDLDCVQWLLVLGKHGFRHAGQIEQIKADPAYPASKRA